MIEIIQAHWVSVLAIMFAVVITPFFWLVILPPEKALKMGWITAVLAALSCVVVLFKIVGILGPLGNILNVLLWVVPPLLAWQYRNYFQGLEQRNIVSLQIFRCVGATFLIEMYRGNIPGTFALPAGIGDILVGLLALFVVIQYKKTPKWGVISVLSLGLLDFVLAFFLGLASLEGPLQLFAHGFENTLLLFPTGLIPIFFVPYAITYHIISLINLVSSDNA